MQIAIVLGLLVVAILMFATEKLSVDIITLLLLVALVLTNTLTPQEAFAGFSNDIIIILSSIFVISGGLQQTGVMDAVGAYLHRVAGQSTKRLTLILMTIVGGMSMLMNNTTTTAVFVPPVLGVARERKLSPSKLLIPLAYASMLGGTCTLIGTSTNVAVSGFIGNLGLKPVSLFELTPIGLIILAVGIAYMLVIGQRLLPDHKEKDLTSDYAIRDYLSEIVVAPDSPLVGQRLFASDLSKMGFRVLAVVRGPVKFQPEPRTSVSAGDVLLVEGKIDNLIKVKETAGIDIRSELKLSADLQTDDIKMAEVLITPQSDLIGRTLSESSFRQRYGLTVLAIYSHGQPVREQLDKIKLRMGDLLLVQGPGDRLASMGRTPDLWVLEELRTSLYRRKKGLYTATFFAVAITLGAFGLIPLSIAFLSAAILTIVFRCITIEEAYEFIDWRLIILIGGMTAFGIAMEKTGAADLLSSWIVYVLKPYGEMVIIAGFFFLTIVLTQPMSNAAAALVVVPVAVSTAQSLGADERTFAIAVMLAGSVSFIAPFEPACILVYGPGKYKFMDFVKTGFGLTILLSVIVLLFLPVFWPLYR